MNGNFIFWGIFLLLFLRFSFTLLRNHNIFVWLWLKRCSMFNVLKLVYKSRDREWKREQNKGLSTIVHELSLKSEKLCIWNWNTWCLRPRSVIFSLTMWCFMLSIRLSLAFIVKYIFSIWIRIAVSVFQLYLLKKTKTNRVSSIQTHHHFQWNAYRKTVYNKWNMFLAFVVPFNLAGNRIAFTAL